jgi:hypothetical protein
MHTYGVLSQSNAYLQRERETDTDKDKHTIATTGHRLQVRTACHKFSKVTALVRLL